MTEPLDLTSLPQLYQTSFTRDTVGSIAEREMRFSVVRAGTLALPSGQLVICDPLVGRHDKPLAQSVLPGRYPVDLSLGFDPETQLEQIVFARILFAHTEPALWVKGLQREEVGGGQADRFGFVSVSGTVGLMDKSAAAQFNPRSLQQLDHFLDNLVANFKPRRSWLNHPLGDEYNGIFLTVGEKERHVRTFFAVDDEGDICLALSSLLL